MSEETRLPKTWSLVPLADIGRWYGGGTPSKAIPAYWESGSIPWVSPKDMKVQHIRESEDYITEAAVSSSATNLIPKDSILLVTRSGILKHSLPVAVNKVDCTINQDLKALVPFCGISPEYVAYALRARAADILARTVKGGTTVQSIEFPELLNYPIPLTSTNEQSRIVEEIERHLTRLDAANESLKRIQANLKRYRAAVLKAACEGRLVPTEAELARAEGRGYETGAQLLQKIFGERKNATTDNRRHEESQQERASSLAELPEGWAWATVEQLTPAGRKCAYGVLQPGDDQPDGILFVRVGDIDNGVIARKNLKRISPLIAKQYPRTLLQGGELLITLVGAIGRTAIVPKELAGANVARAVGVVPLTDLVEAAWVETWFRAPSNQNQLIMKAHEVARKTLNLEDVRSAPVALPPLAEQKRIRQEVGRRMSILEEIEATVEANLLRSLSLRQALLSSAFKGELVTQDPNDEPASALLERIRQTRASQPAEPRARKARTKPVLAPLPPPVLTEEPPPADEPGPQEVDFLELSRDEQVDVVWGSLFTRGALDKDAAIRDVAEELRSIDFARFKRLRKDGPLYGAIAAAIERGVREGRFDRPRRGCVRAVLSDPRNYNDEDWRWCLLEVVGAEPVDIDTALRAAAEKAREALGLEYVRLREDGVILTRLRAVLEEAVRTGELVRKGGRVRRGSGPTGRETSAQG